MGTPICVVDEVLQQAGYHIPDEDDQEEHVLAEFRDFLDEVTPDDFMGETT